jgi:hypothetical protein
MLPRPLYPPLVALWFVIIQWRQLGATGGRWGDLTGSALAAAALAVVALGIGRMMTRNPARAGLVALVVVVWSAVFGTIRILARAHASTGAGEAVLVWTLFSFALVVIVRRVPAGERTSQALTTAALLLLLMQGLGMAASARPTPAPAAAAVATVGRSPSRPDIYVIITDKYSASTWLAAHYGYSNQAMEDSLRRLGFVLPAAVRANYPHTGLALASMFNGRPLQDLITDSGAGWSSIAEQIEDAKVWEFLRARGYRFAFFPTTYPLTSSNRRADLVLTPPPREVLVAAPRTWLAHAPFAALSELARCGLAPCPASNAAVLPYPLESSDAIRGKLRLLATLPDSTGPIVAFLHVISPHEPYQFNADCSDREPWWPLSDEGISDAVRAAYAAQVACVNTLLLETVRQLLARSTVPPVILLQSDHGHGLITLDALVGRTVPLAEMPPAMLRERLDLFAAYHAPGLESAWYDSITPVNVFPILLNAYFDAGWPRSADQSWWPDVFQYPLRLQPVTASQLRLR